MSLEQALKENTEAIKALTLALGAKTPTPTLSEEVFTEPVKRASKKTPATVVNTVVDTETPANKPVAAVKDVPNKTENPSFDPSYAPVKQAILSAISGGHRAAVTKILSEYNAKNGQDLPREVYDEVLGKLDAVINGEGDLA